MCSKKTRAVKGGKAPFWKETLTLEIGEMTGPWRLEIEARDKDLVKVSEMSIYSLNIPFRILFWGIMSGRALLFMISLLVPSGLSS